MHVHLFLSGSQCKLGQVPGKITAFGEVKPIRFSQPLSFTGKGCTEPYVQSDTRINRFETLRLLPGGFMKASPIKRVLRLTSISLFILLAACAPKQVIYGRVVDAETDQPIKGAAVAIRWFENQADKTAGPVNTFDVAQDLSSKDGSFNIPDHPDKHLVMGVYKEGYICWSSRSSFSNGKNQATITKQNPRIEDGIEVRLEPLREGDSQDQHAGFTVLVAEEVTASKKSPFYEAIKPLFKRWRDNMRKQFRKMFGKDSTTESN